MTKLKMHMIFSEGAFPWNALCVTPPFAGEAHVYACRAMAPFIKFPDRGILMGTPTLTFIEEYGTREDSHPVFVEIYKFFLAWEEDKIKSKTDAVLSFLYGQPDFRNWAEKEIIRLHTAGRLWIDKSYFYEDD